MVIIYNFKDKEGNLVLEKHARMYVPYGVHTRKHYIKGEKKKRKKSLESHIKMWYNDYAEQNELTILFEGFIYGKLNKGRRFIMDFARKEYAGLGINVVEEGKE